MYVRRTHLKNRITLYTTLNIHPNCNKYLNKLINRFVPEPLLNTLASAATKLLELPERKKTVCFVPFVNK